MIRSRPWVGAALAGVLSVLAQGARASDTPRDAKPDDATWDVTLARGETREIDFTVDEGTFMSIDVSPDGQWLVFDLLAHVYRLPIEGGAAECLTQDSGVAINVHPRFSPDGSEIAFVSDRQGQDNLWIMNADGTEPRIVSKELGARFYEPEWTRDGDYVVASGFEWGPPGTAKRGLWLFHKDGGSGLHLVSGSAAWPTMSPDGRYVYFHERTGRAAQLATIGSLGGRRQIRRFDLESGQRIPVTYGTHQQQRRMSSGGAYAGEISPDGRSLAFARRIPDGTISWKGHRFGPRTALWLRDLHTGSERLLLDPIEQDAAETGKTLRILPGYAWTPDGRSIVLSRGGRIHKLDVATGELELIPFEARVQRTISEQARARFRIDDGPFRARFLRWHTATADGRRLAFQAVGRIWIQSLPQGSPRRLTPESFKPFEFAPAWSPDGRRLAFTTWSQAEGGHVWTAGAQGGEPERLTGEAGEYLNPVWSLDGQEVVVARGSGATRRGRPWTANAWFDLVRLSMDGTEPETVARVPPSTSGNDSDRHIVRASYGPEGRIYFPMFVDEKGEGATRLVSVAPDGTDRREHVQLPHADEVVISPDGRHVAFQEGDNVFVTPLPGIRSVAPIELNRRRGALPIEQVTRSGGLNPRFRDASTLEYGSGYTYSVHDLVTGETETTEVRLEVPRPIPDGRLALTGARIVTLQEDRVLENATIVVAGARIDCLGECDTAGATRVIDASGTTIIPGFVDLHAHHYRENRGVNVAGDWEQAIYLAYGVTSNLDVFPAGQAVFSTAELVEAGDVVGPRAFSTGDAFTGWERGRANDLESYEVTEENAERVVSWGAVGLKQYMQRRRDQRQWMSDVAREKGLMVTGEGGGLAYNMSVVMDGQTGWEHAFSYVPIYSDVARFFGKAGAFYSPTFVVGGAGPWSEEYFYQRSDTWRDEKLRRWLPWRQLIPHTRRRVLRPETDYSFPMVAQGLADVIAEGGHGVIGSHGQHHGIAAHWEVWMAASALGPEGALEVASLHGARSIGIDQDTGSLQVGKLADLMVLNSNPLEDIENTLDMRHVMKGGVLYDADTLDEVWPESRPFGDYYWIDEDTLRDDDRPAR